MSETFGHSGAWGIAAIMIVVVSWLFYRYLAPKAWREWAVSGLVQAFIISLYAEMYGFPLTIYLLVRFSGLDHDYLNASLWSTLLGAGEMGMMIAMLLGYAVAFVGLGILIHGWRELYRAHRQKRLATDGLYALVRHPQYTGLLLGLFGEGVVHWPTIFSVGLFPVIALAYGWLARNEDKRMLDRFGEEFRAYKRRVPMFIPHWGQWRKFASSRRAAGGRAGTKSVVRLQSTHPVLRASARLNPHRAVEPYPDRHHAIPGGIGQSKTLAKARNNSISTAVAL